MKIGLIDVDTSRKFPNLPLMKLSAWHKGRGDTVEWYNPFNGWYDKVYVSKVFSFSPDWNDIITADEVVRGGTGYCIDLVDGKEVFRKERDIPLPHDVEHIYPDYSLYPTLTKDTAYGFLTRGCPRGCHFCIVGQKEGLRSVHHADLEEFWTGQKNIVLLDPNILAYRECDTLLERLAETGCTVDFNQGLDIRMMTQEKAELLSRIRAKEFHFAWDRYEDKDFIVPRLKMFAGISSKELKTQTYVYTIVNFNTTLEQDLDRIYTLRDMGYQPYVMIYDKAHCDKVYMKLQRWCNSRQIFFTCKRFEDYDAKVRNKTNNITRNENQGKETYRRGDAPEEDARE